MTLNAPPYDIKVWLYYNTDPIGVWGPNPTDISSYVRYPGNDGGQAITYSAGRQNEADQVDAGVMNLTLDNRDGRFSTHNALGPYYPYLEPGNPIRLAMTSCRDTFTRTTSGSLGTSDTENTWTSSGNWSTNGSAATFSGVGTNTISFPINNGGSAVDVDMQVTVTLPNAATGDVLQGGVVLRWADIDNHWRAFLEFTSAGRVNLRLVKVVATVTTNVFTQDVGAYTANNGWRLHVQASGDSVYASAYPLAGGSDTAWIGSGSEPLLAGRATGLMGYRGGSNTNTGTFVTWDDYVTTALEWAGTVSSWPVDWDMKGDNCWASITANGILRRLSQGTREIKSALTRQLPAYSPTGYWPLEDGSGATSLANLVSGRPAAQVAGNVSVSAGQGPDGGAQAIMLSDATGQVFGRAAPSLPSGVHGFSGMIFTKFTGAIPAVDTGVITWNALGTITSYYRFVINGTNVTMSVESASGTVLSTSTNSIAGLVDLTEWVAWQIETDVSGANTNWSFILHQVGRVDYYALTGSFVGAADTRCTGFTINPRRADLSGTMFAHSWVGPNTLPFVTDSFSLVSSGYATEKASDRVTRLCMEEGIPVIVEAGESVQMGPQPLSSIVPALQQCQDADQGILYERDNGLGFRPHHARFNQTLGLTLTVSAGHLSGPPRAINDDQRLRNKWTVSRIGGSTSVAQDDDSISRRGTYDDSISVNLYSDLQLEDHAGWRLYLGTYPALRWPQITLEITRVPGAVQIWRGRRYGFRMTVATGRAQITGNDPDVIVEGYQATLYPHKWQVQMNCSSATMWDQALIGTLRLDADNSTLSVAATNVATSITVTNNGDPYSTWAPTSILPAEVPFNINVNGEIMTVTNVGDLGTPSANKQVLTVTRGVNGVAKAQDLFTPVKLATPTYLTY